MVVLESYFGRKGEPGDYVLEFGRHKGKSVAQVVTDHPDYAQWAVTQQDAAVVNAGLYKFLVAHAAFKEAQALRVPSTIPPELTETAAVLGLGLADLVEIPAEPRDALPGEDTEFMNAFVGATPPDPAARLAQIEAAIAIEPDEAGGVETEISTRPRKQRRFIKPLEARGLGEFTGQTDPVLVLGKEDILSSQVTVPKHKGKKVITRMLRLKLKRKRNTRRRITS